MKTLVTGMSGTGKSSVTRAVAAKGVPAYDLDGDDWSHWVACDDNPTGAKPGYDWLWREDTLDALLNDSTAGTMILSGCASNMGRFVGRFDRIVLLSGPIDVLLARVGARTDNPYGKSALEAERIAENLREFEPRLRAIATDIVDVAQSLEDVVDAVLRIARPNR